MCLFLLKVLLSFAIFHRIGLEFVAWLQPSHLPAFISHPSHSPLSVSLFLSFALTPLSSPWQPLHIPMNCSKSYFAGGTWELFWLLPQCSCYSKAMEHNRLSCKHCLQVCVPSGLWLLWWYFCMPNTLSTELGTFLLNEGSLCPLYACLAVFLP